MRRNHSKFSAALLTICLSGTCGFSAMAMELGGFDLSIGDEITDGWWSQSDDAADAAAESEYSRWESDDKENSVSGSVETIRDPAVNPANGAGGFENGLDSAPENDISEKKSVEESVSGNEATEIQSEEESPDIVQPIEDRPSGRKASENISADTKEMEESLKNSEVTEKHTAGDLLTDFSKGDRREAYGKSLKLYYYKGRIENIHDKEITCLLIPETEVLPLSVRADGRECGWEEEDSGILLRTSVKSESVIIEALLLYEAGKSTPVIQCIPAA